MEDTTQTPTNTPVAAPVEDDTPPVEAAPAEVPAAASQQVEPTPVEATDAPDPVQEATPAVEEEEAYPTYQPIPNVAPIDFSQLPVDENNLIDPNALAQQINSRMAQVEQNSMARAQQIYAEQEVEKKQWEKAYEKYPDLKTNKELRDMVHNARLGKVTEILSTTDDASQIKFPTPSQMADSLFKHISAQKAEGFKQANQNTVVQQSAVLETSGKAGDSDAEANQSALKNLNNPNKEIANQARNALLRKKLGWD